MRIGFSYLVRGVSTPSLKLDFTGFDIKGSYNQMFAFNRSIVILLGINKRSITPVRLDQFSVRQPFYDHFIPY